MEKPYQITYRYEPDYLFASISGDIDSIEISIQYWQEVASECKKHGYRKVLVEEKLESTVSEEESYEFGKILADLFTEKVLVAFVDSKKEHYKINKVCEMIVQNRGFRGRICKTIEEAHKWLLENEPNRIENTHQTT